MEYLSELYSEATDAWNGLDGFRHDRERNKNYLYGRQWDDLIEVDGQLITEGAYIRSQGSVPLKNNLIRRLVRNVLGVWRNSFRLPQCRSLDHKEGRIAELVNKLLVCNAQANRLTELYARTMEEFLISGMAIHRKRYGELHGRSDCITRYVHPDNFFFTSEGCDFRSLDMTMAGEMHNTTVGAAIRHFCSDVKSVERLCEAFGVKPADTNVKIRIAEVWREETELMLSWHDSKIGKVVSTPYGEGPKPPADTEVYREWRHIWRYYFLGPDGAVLKKGESPYPHGEHPYVVKIYPYIDGEVHSFVADVIDQQRYTNRLITMYDWVMRASAKGVLLFPEGSLPEDADLQDVADEWSRFNGVISYRAKPGMPGPEQVSCMGSQNGITDLLNIQLKMFEDISGVHSALEGKLEGSSVSGTLYKQQTQNALTSLRDLIESFREFVLEGTMKDASNLMSFYSRERMVEVAGEQMAGISEEELQEFRSPELDLRFE